MIRDWKTVGRSLLVFKVIKNRVFELLEKKLQYDTYKSIRIWYEHLTTRDKKHLYRAAYFHKKKKNAKEKYCIIRLQAPGLMTFAAAIQYIFVYEWAKNKGYIPVLDLEFEYNYMHNRLGEDNVWEYTFEQPISVKEALQKDWVLVESINVGDKWLPQTCLDINGKADDHYLHAVQDNWRNYYRKVHQYIEPIWTFKEDILDKYKTKYADKIRGENVLGVMLREAFSKEASEKITDTWAKECYNQHPMAPDIYSTIEIVKECMKRWKCQKILLCTAYEESLEAFQREFGERFVLYIERKRCSLNTMVTINDTIRMDAEEICARVQENGMDEIVRTYSYEVIALADCQYFIGAKCSGTSAALAINGGKYKDIYILPDANNIKRY